MEFVGQLSFGLLDYTYWIQVVNLLSFSSRLVVCMAVSVYQITDPANKPYINPIT